MIASLTMYARPETDASIDVFWKLLRTALRDHGVCTPEILSQEANVMDVWTNPKLVIEQCKAGIVGSFPSLNARPKELLDDWLFEIKEELEKYNNSNPNKPAAPFAINHCGSKIVYMYENTPWWDDKVREIFVQDINTGKIITLDAQAGDHTSVEFNHDGTKIIS